MPQPPTEDVEPPGAARAKATSVSSQVLDDPLGTFFQSDVPETPADPLEEAVVAAVAALAETEQRVPPSRRGSCAVGATEVSGPGACAAVADVPLGTSAASDVARDRCGTDKAAAAISAQAVAAPKSGEVAAPDCAEAAPPRAVKEEEPATATAAAMSLPVAEGSTAGGAPEPAPSSVVKKEEAAAATPLLVAEGSAAGGAPGAASVGSGGLLVASSHCGVQPSQALGASGAAGGHSPSMRSKPTPDAQIVDVALIFRGRRNLVRHLSNTRVGEIVDQHPSLARMAKRPLVLVDRDGFEMGRELQLSRLLTGSSAIGANGSSQKCPPLLELELRPDEWAE